MITFEQIEKRITMEEMIDSWMFASNAAQQLGQELRDYKAFIKARRIRILQRVVVYGFLISVIAGLWLIPTEWLHWICRIVFTAILLTLVFCVWGIDHAEEPKKEVPANREEEIIDQEMSDQEAALINYEMEEGELDRIKEFEGREL